MWKEMQIINPLNKPQWVTHYKLLLTLFKPSGLYLKVSVGVRVGIEYFTQCKQVLEQAEAE